MGKIVKYCGSCEEGFAEKYTFCPDCGGQLQAYEMNPVAAGSPEVVRIADNTADNVDFVASPKAPTGDGGGPEAVPAAVLAEFDSSRDELILDGGDAEYDDLKRDSRSDEITSSAASDYEDEDDGYRVTVIEETNAGQRNGLLLGASVFMILFVMSATVYSLFSKDLGLGAIGDDGVALASLIENVPMPVEEEQPKKEKDDAGGGGGGGKNEPNPVNQGDLVNQTKNPIRPPDVHVPRLDNPSLTLPPPSTQGNKKFEQVYGVYGDPNSRFGKLSNGPGSGGGIGTGFGTGQGSGSGTGTGSGTGSGYGAGDGDGNGNGSGSGNAGSGAPPPPPTGITSAMSIISKPRPGYTDAARQNGVQGTVRLRVTFLANGTIGSISPISGLPHGLTEQAIAAARQIKFEPKKVNGVAVAVTRQIEYSFSIY